MPTNEQRREAAKRKLERQLESRAARARRRKQTTIAAADAASAAVVPWGGGAHMAMGNVPSRYDIALRTTGTLVAGETSVAVDVPSGYSATGDWSRTGDETVQFDNWSKVTETDPLASEVEVPAPDYTTLTAIEATCTADQLLLAGPGVPIGATWVR